MDLKHLLFLKAASGPGEQNLLDYSDLVNKNYGGSVSMDNVRTEGTIPVRPGASMVLTGPQTTSVDVRFYDTDGNYNDQKVSKYNEGTPYIEFTVPDDCYSLRPKWYRTPGGLTVEELIASRPVIKYV